MSTENTNFLGADSITVAAVAAAATTTAAAAKYLNASDYYNIILFSPPFGKNHLLVVKAQKLVTQQPTPSQENEHDS